MSKLHSHHTSLYVYFLATIFFSNIAIAAEQIYLREYTYQASEADSKLSARTIALQEVKRILLSELGTHVSSLVKQQSSSDGTQLGTEQIETLSAGVTRVEILDEKWNGVVYVLKAQIKADPEDVLKSLHKMLDNDKKQKQLSQLGGDLSKIRSENIQIAESLAQSKKEATAALVEIANLKKQLDKQQTDTSRQTLQATYKQQVDKLMLYEWFESALKSNEKGDYKSALRWYQKAAEQGLAAAQFNLGVMYIKNEGIAPDSKQSVYWFKKAAEQGLADAQFNLGVRYTNGEGVTRDAKQAAHWFQNAAKQGDGDAQVILGSMYGKGEGVSRDAKLSVYWYQKAAEQGHIVAQFNLGGVYGRGDGVVRDTKQAVYWWQKAAEQGDAYSQYFLGVMYAHSEGVVRNAKQAVYWWEKAAKQGIAEAQYSLGVAYSTGNGITLDAKQAVSWWQKAAEQGLADAQFNLGVMYGKGVGVARNIKQADYWVQKAAEQGHVDARAFLNSRK